MRHISQQNKNAFYIVLTTFLCGLIMVAYAAQLTVPVIADETITMANAAWATGRDWSLMIAQTGGRYYRYIQALMTVPFFVWLKDPDQIYRFSMILQALIQVSTVPIVYLICRRHLRMQSPLTASLIAAAVCFVPSIALYTLYYRGDYLLPVLPWYALLFFLEAMRAAQSHQRARRIGFTVLTLFCCVLAYMAHTRGIVLIIAVVITALASRLLMKRRSIHWPVFLLSLAVLAVADSLLTGTLQQALYSVSGVTGNSFESTNMGSYFSFFSYESLKSLFMLCISWLNTLIVTTEGLIVIGGVAVIAVAVLLLRRTKIEMTDGEKITLLFSFLIFAGYFAVGALFFKNNYINLASGATTRRVDRLLYDRYSICGAGMLIFVALYVLCCRREWFGNKLKIVSYATAALVFGLFFWKCVPIAAKYKGYINNTITLNTFRTVGDTKKIPLNFYYDRTTLLAACLLGFLMMAGVLLISCYRKKRMSYILLAFVLVCDLALIQVNYVKVRKKANDIVEETTADVVDFLQEMEDEITEEYPYILRLSGESAAFYQPQLMDYILFGTEQEESLDLDDYFVICSRKNAELPDEGEDCYLFDAFDYRDARYDFVYVKGEALAEELEDLGYQLTPCVSEESRQEAS